MSERTSAPAPAPRVELVRGLGAVDGALLTVGSVVGTGIFLTAGDVARAVPHAGLVLLVWLVGGLLTLAGALSYGELGVMFPRAGGLYVYLREAWGPVWGFLYGWTCMLVIMTGGLAAIAVGFGEYLGVFVPWFSSAHVLGSVPIGALTWSVSGAQVAAALAILLLTAVNHFGVREGAGLQNLFTVLKVAAIAGLLLFGFTHAAQAPVALAAPLPASAPPALLVAFGAAMISALWTYDGWYALNLSAGEVRDPARNLPRGLIGGVLMVVVLYLLLNLVYLRTLSLDELAATPRVAEVAATRLLGSDGGRWISLAVVISSFGCLAATVLYTSRIYLPMAEDGVFFRRVARVHPRWRTPVASLWLQSAWAVVLTLSGSYTQLLTYSVFGGVLFHVLAGLAVFRLRRTRPDAPRPYRAWGYPLVPALFVLGMLLLVGSTLQTSPRESLLGLLAVAIGLPAYAYWRRSARESRP